MPPQMQGRRRQRPLFAHYHADAVEVWAGNRDGGRLLSGADESRR
jgi:hypothetical protein